MAQIPWKSITGLKEEVERLISDYVGRAAGVEPGMGWTPSWDLIERPREFVLLVELPGVGADGVEIALAGSQLTVRGEKRQEPPAIEETYHMAERPYGIFSRSLTVPAGVETERISAQYRQGVLRVVMPKSEPAQARRIIVEEQESS